MSTTLEQLVNIERIISQRTATSGSGASSGPAYYEDLRKANHNGALSQIEQLLLDSPDSLETRLWWVRCQLELGGLPPSALSAPLEEIFEQIKDQRSLALLSCSIFLLLGRALARRKQLRLGVVMYERAFEFAELCQDFSEQEAEFVRGLYVQALKDEIERAEKRFEKQPYIDGLTTKLSKARKAKIKEKPVRPKRDQSLRKKRIFNSKSILAGHVEELAPKLSGKGSKLSEEKSKSFSVERSDKGSKTGKSEIANTGVAKKQSRVATRIFFSLVLITGLSGVALLFAWRRGENYSEHLTMQTTSQVNSQLQVPEMKVQSVSGAEQRVALESVKSRLERLARTSSEGRDGLGSNSVAARQNAGAEVNPQPGEGVAEVRESHTRKPAGVVRNQSLLQNEPQRSVSRQTQAKSPLLNPEVLANTKVENLDRSVDTPESGRLVKGPYGRLYEPPAAASGESKPVGRGRRHEAIGLDGSVVRSYPVEQFNKPVLYRTITKANVLEAPSWLSAVVAQVEVGKTIHVVARMGHWLELRSQGGERGYIYAQDAEQVKE